MARHETSLSRTLLYIIGIRHTLMFPSPRGLRSATNGVLLAPGFCDRGFGDCRCRLGRPIAYFDGTLKVFHEPYLPAIRNGSVEPLPDRRMWSVLSMF